MSTPRVRFMHLQPAEDAPAVDAAIRRVIDRGWYVLGPEVEAFEAEFAAACEARASVGVGTGTDAIAIILRGLGIGAGDEVITTPLSAAYTALACMMVGARPVFADIDPARLTIDPAAIEAAITPRTAAILPVHLYGQPADMPAIMADRRAALARRRRGLLPGAPAPRAAAGRSAASAWRPPTASTRRRTSARWATAARSPRATRAGGEAEAHAQRRPDRSLPPRRDGREQPARRDAGGDSRGPAAVPARLDRGAARAGGHLPARARRARPSPCRPSAIPATSTTCSRCSRSSATACRRSCAAGHRDAHSLPGADPAPAGAAVGAARRRARWPIACARRCCRCRLYPGDAARQDVQMVAGRYGDSAGDTNRSGGVTAWVRLQPDRSSLES